MKGWKRVCWRERRRMSMVRGGLGVAVVGIWIGGVRVMGAW